MKTYFYYIVMKSGFVHQVQSELTRQDFVSKVLYGAGLIKVHEYKDTDHIIYIRVSEIESFSFRENEGE